MKDASLAALAKSLYVYKNHRTGSEQGARAAKIALFDIAGTTSPWLAPIKVAAVPLDIASETIRDALGWTAATEKVARTLSLAVVVGFFLLGIHVFRLGLEVSDPLRPAANPLGATEVWSFFLRATMAVRIGATLFQCLQLCGGQLAEDLVLWVDKHVWERPWN